MRVHAFRMQLKPGMAEDYKARHDAIWPELAALLHEAGIRDYSIFLDEATGALFAMLKLTEDATMDQLPSHPVMRRWWDHMAALMEVAPDNQPLEWPLRPVFHLP
ncbi:L-rhamnose mutarotase [Sphingomonas sp. S2M10]|mgnify:CR=1 FL=1|uniref:L-rhamnose mutarotase n=1 Tax=Sphingomonas sp. S2M10 TaxID=2705010 RepID=UPI001456C9BC|nr:L-rhamnose mutarotase [Sphingomonas sp. S2M10]NLS26510.1 L-rhamnose mutarotase [Sphingomonas sp. S2M10]